MEVRFTTSARKHRIGRAHALNVFTHVEPALLPSDDDLPERWLWIGIDDRGLPARHSCHAVPFQEAVMPKYNVGPDVDLDKTVVRDKNGKRITEARARHIAKSTPVPNVGRPSLTAPGQRSPEVKARVPLKTKQKLERVARRRQMTPSQLLRELLEEYLKTT